MPPPPTGPSPGPSSPAARLVVEVDRQEFRVAVTGDRFSIGSDAGSSLALARPGVAPHHAVLQREGGHWEVFDLFSPGGVFVNGTRVEAAALKHGDRIRIGDVGISFLLDQPRRAVAAAPPAAPSRAALPEAAPPGPSVANDDGLDP